MDQNAERILEEAMKLPPEARAALAGSLLDSLDQALDETAESEWEAEITRRVRELRNSEIRPVPWAEA
jgi:putative addiction module component (TIGR02574 family)